MHQLTGRRITTIQIPLTRRERLGHWWCGVIAAIREEPPIERTKWVHLNPGDPGYDKAPLLEGYDPHPLHFDAAGTPD